MRSQGLDLSDSFIRLVVLERRGNSYRLPVRAEIPVPPDVIVDGELRQAEVVVNLLRQLYQAAGLKQRQPVVALPERHTFIKLIPLDVSETSRQTVGAALAEVAEQHVPYPLNETTYDWQVLPDRNSAGQVQVLLGVAPKDLVNRYLEVMGQAGITPRSLDIESLAMSRATFRPNQTTGSHVLLDLGRSRSTLTLLRGDIVQFSTTVRYAGLELNRYIAQSLSITDAEAERAKALFGLDPHRGRGVLRQVLAPQIDILAEKVRQLENFYADHFVDHQPISDVALIGSGAMMRGIELELADRLHQPVHQQPSWVYQELLQRDPATPAEIGLAYSTAIGLALEPLLS